MGFNRYKPKQKPKKVCIIWQTILLKDSPFTNQNKTNTYKNAVNRQQCSKYAQQVPNHVLFCASNMLRLTLCIL